MLRNLSEAGFEVAPIDAPSVPIDWSEFQQGELGNCNVVAWRRPHRGKLDRSAGRDTVLPDAVIRRS